MNTTYVTRKRNNEINPCV